jgi:CRP/FNR family transcriptional regulator, nitrogen oxide reductase regulator
MLTIKPFPRISQTAPRPKGFVSTMDVFKKLPLSKLAEVERRMIEKKYARGSTIHLEGDPAEYVWFVKEGHVKAMIYTPNGRPLTLCMVGSGGMFGSCCCFGSAQHACQGVAETDTTVYALPMGDFLDLLAQFPVVSVAVVETVSKRLRHSKGTHTFEQESVEKRILNVLVNMVEEFGNTIPLTRREIAEMAGTTVETSIRTFSDLEKRGLVSTERGRITVKNVDKLKEEKP